MNKPVYVIVTIDTEEDDWGSYRSRGYSVENIRLLQDLVPVWERFGARPTYFVNYPPMASAEASSVLRFLAGENRSEMGVHCHPWNSPPLREIEGRPLSMMNLLTDEENHAKIRVLAELSEELFHSRPTSFRAGRWGLGPAVARPLRELGFTVDASVSPLLDWTGSGGPNYTRAPRRPYRFEPHDPFQPAEAGELVEIPTSVGFLWGKPDSSATLRAALEGSFLARFRVVGLLDSLGLFARRWISPETSSGRDMVRLAKTLTRSGVQVLDLTFHSSSLLPGATPFVRSLAEKEKFLERIERFLGFCHRQGFYFSTASEVGEAVRRGELT